ncbi:hypothetical protein YQE_03620, partial [Dendroctonus ponderosae]
MIGFGADNAAVMMGNKTGVKAKLMEVNPSIFVMGCSCYFLHLCASAAARKLPKSVEQPTLGSFNGVSTICKHQTISDVTSVSNAMVIASMVTTGVDLNIIDVMFRNCIKKIHPQIRFCKRIISGQRGTPTLMMRLITGDHATYESLMTDDLPYSGKQTTCTHPCTLQ